MSGRSTSEIKQLILWTIAMVFLAVVVFWCAYLVRGALLLVYCSVLLAIGFSPIVRLIERQTRLPIGSKRFPRWLAILVLYLAIISVLALIGALIFPPLVRQAQSLWGALPDMFERTQRFLIDKGILARHFTLSEAVAKTPGTGGDAAGAIAGAVVNVVGGIFGIVTILILTFYLLVESRSLTDTFLRLFPKHQRARVHDAGREVTIKVSAWLGGQLLLGGIIGGSSAIGLWALGIPFFYVLALVSGVGELIPVIGPFLSAIPALAVAATVSLDKVIFVAIFFVVQQQFENHLLVPRIMSKQVGLSAVMVIVSLLVGGSLLGILGALLAVPTAAILQVIALQVWKE
ncbi:MAG TPA: AI-2E family transporter [Vicinamibacterales bacterium]|nr:AI-2E family transporter [Vicinamibacterales bacterium]